MAIKIGTMLGSHELTGFLGKGGMGEVYRARDTKLKRDVAIKILPDEFSRDPERVSRFQREAEVLASINHRNIAAIYDIQEANGTRFLVLELVEGETLAERLKRGPIPLDEALDIAKHIGEALEAAHEKGIVHRDLKLANVKITPDGTVKVLDFGLAKVREAQDGLSLSNSQFSPDGRWIAYVSDESQRSEVYATPFPPSPSGPAGKRQISTAGVLGALRWRGDGKEIFYRSPDQQLMHAEVAIKAGTLEVGSVRALFRLANIGVGFDVSADGQRFLLPVLPEAKGSEPLTLIQNWAAGLRRR